MDKIDAKNIIINLIYKYNHEKNNFILNIYKVKNLKKIFLFLI